MMIDPENPQYYRLNHNKEVVDIRKLSGKELKELLSFYSGKLKKVRSNDMRKTYEGIIEQLNEFIYTGKASGPPDVFIISKMMGLKDVRGFIQTYLGKVQSRYEIAEEKINEHYRARDNSYDSLALPDDQIVTSVFSKIFKTDPPQIDNAANLFLDHYKIEHAKIRLRPEEETLVVYDYVTNEIIINPSEAGSRLGLLEALLLGLFDYMANVKSWKFSDNIEQMLDSQKTENRQFVRKFFFRCSELGLLPPPRKG